jgi:hypothetical protein
MCELSDKLKLCTCDVGSVADLTHYWVLHRFVGGKNHMVVGRTAIRDTLDPKLEAHNRALLLARLNEGDVFDVDPKPHEGDRLLLSFRCEEAGKPKTIQYGYAHVGGQWIEEPYDALGWQWHHDRGPFGDVRAALETHASSVVWLFAWFVKPHTPDAATETSLLQTLLASGPLGWLEIGAILVACILQVAWMMRDLPKRMDVAAFGTILTKLVDAGNAERAVKLCLASSSHVGVLAGVGLEAQARGASARDAMREAFPDILRRARSGLVPVMAIGAAGLLECCVLLAKGMDHEAAGKVILGYAWVPAALAAIMIRNGLRYGAIERELRSIEGVVAR